MLASTLPSHMESINTSTGVAVGLDVAVGDGSGLEVVTGKSVGTAVGVTANGRSSMPFSPF